MGNDIPVISEKMMEMADSIFAHGGQRAKSHDQRFGQWLVNKIRTDPKYKEGFDECYKDPSNPSEWKAYVEQILFNVENQEIYDWIKDYND